MPKAKKKDSRLSRAGVSGYNKPKRTPNHPKKSHVVVAKVGSKVKTIRFGQQGVKTAGKPKKGESAKQKARRKSFKARHGKNIAKGKMSAAYWANKVKWQIMAIKKVKGVSVSSLTNRQASAMKKHSKHHTVKHLRSMVASMKKGKTFGQSHKIAMKKVGK